VHWRGTSEVRIDSPPTQCNSVAKTITDAEASLSRNSSVATASTPKLAAPGMLKPTNG